MGWLQGITSSMDMILSKLWEIMKDREVWHAAIHRVTKSQIRLSSWLTKTLLDPSKSCSSSYCLYPTISFHPCDSPLTVAFYFLLLDILSFSPNYPVLNHLPPSDFILQVTISLENKILKWFNELKLGKFLHRANTYTKLLTGSQLFPNKTFLLFTYTKQNYIHLIISRFLNKSENLKNM